MTVSFVGAQTADNGPTPASSITLSLVAANPGDVLVAFITAGATALEFKLNGYTELPLISPVEVDVSGGSGGTILLRAHCYTKVVSGFDLAAQPFELVSGTALMVGALMVYRGVDNADVVGALAKIGTAAGPTTLIAGHAAFNADSMQVALYASLGANSYTPPAGMTERFDAKVGSLTISGSDLLLTGTPILPQKTATPLNQDTSGSFSVLLRKGVDPIVIGGPAGLPADIPGGFSIG